MPKIYIVKSSNGVYEDYREWNEKAFCSKKDADEFAKELDKKHFNTPNFITDGFVLAYDDIIAPEWDDPPCSYLKNPEEYQSWIKDMQKKDKEYIINEMYKQGFLVTEQMLDMYDDWSSNQYYDWHNCIVEEIELI